MKRSKLFVFVTVFYSLLPALLQGQVDTAWVRRYNGPGNVEDYANAITVDGQGNVYVTGKCWGLIGAYDYGTVKYNSTGIQEWAQTYDGPGNANDEASAIAIDGQGNIYVTGSSCFSGPDFDCTTIKYNSFGVQQWIQRPNYSNGGSAIAIDNSGNIYVTGSSSSSYDYMTIKYNSAGETLWVRGYNGPGNDIDYTRAITVDNTGNIYVTGLSTGSGSGGDYATIKYNSAGETLWVRRYNGLDNDWDEPNAMAVDGLGNVYVTGQSYDSVYNFDYTTIKYNSAGVVQWIQRYNPAGYWDGASAIAVDNQGNIYVTGTSNGFGTSYDYATIKYNPNGETLWVRRYNGPGNGSDYAYAIAVDGQDNVYVTGESRGTSTYIDYATIKYNSLGVQQWVQRYNGPGNQADRAKAIAVDSAGNVYVTGTSLSTSSTFSEDYATIKYVQTQGVEEIASLPLAKTSGVEVFPNPASSVIRVRYSSSVKEPAYIKIFDIIGKVVKEIAASASQTRNDNAVRVSLNGIKNGVYFVKVGNEIIREKLVISK